LVEHSVATWWPVGSADAEDINNLNVVVGEYYDGARYHGFLLKNGSYTSFDANAPNVESTNSVGINDFGVVSGAYGTSSRSRLSARPATGRPISMLIPQWVPLPREPTTYYRRRVISVRQPRF
jgi:hypothetical protein